MSAEHIASVKGWHLKESEVETHGREFANWRCLEDLGVWTADGGVSAVQGYLAQKKQPPLPRTTFKP